MRPDPAAEILAVLRRLPRRERMDVFAVAIRAAIDLGLLDDEPERETRAMADAAVAVRQLIGDPRDRPR